MKGKPTYTKVNQLRYDSFSQKYIGTSGQVHSAFDGILFLLAELKFFSSFRASLETHVQRVSDIHISFRMCQVINNIVGKLMMMALRF